MKVSKLKVMFVAMLLCAFMASTAMALNVTNRSAEMDDFSPCDLAGTIQMVFQQADWTNIEAYLDANDYALIRVALGGVNLPSNPTLPSLCKDITGTFDGTGLGIPYTNLVALDDVGIEISGFAAPLDADIYVHGKKGDQFIEVFITALNAAPGAYGWTSQEDSPWFKIGLDAALVGEGTSICAQVTSYSGVSLLTISNEAFPNTLTFSGDNEIGHFITQRMTARDCEKEEASSCSTTKSISLCALGVQSSCPTYSRCFVAEGDFPPTGLIDLVIRTNGAENIDNTQEGVYFDSIRIYDENGAEIGTPGGGDWSYYKADGTTPSAGAGCDAYDAEVAKLTLDASSFASAGNELRFCVAYTVKPDEADPDTNVRFWTTGVVVPCGSLWNTIITGASLNRCEGSGSMYFPYVLTQSGAWTSGIAVTNRDKNMDPSEMEATFTLYDSTGASFTYTKNDFTTKVWAFILDSILSEFSGTPAPGAAWLEVNTNFNVDGYEFVSDGVFGAGTLPRLSD